jgi:acetyl-CoA carboxylase beta subunit
MSLKDMFKKRTLSPQEVKQAERVRKAKDTLLEFQAPEGLFQKCNCCGKPVYNPDIPNDTAHRSYERQGIDRVSEIHEGDRLPLAGRKSRE